jgi:hypothetical protein
LSVRYSNAAELVTLQTSKFSLGSLYETVRVLEIVSHSYRGFGYRLYPWLTTRHVDFDHLVNPVRRIWKLWRSDVLSGSSFCPIAAWRGWHVDTPAYFCQAHVG